MFENSLELEIIFRKYNLKVIDIENKRNIKKIEENCSYREKLRSYSATRIQSYIDCPRKYYYQYIKKINLNIKSSCLLTPDIKGIIEHSVIKKSIESFKRMESYKV